LWISLFGAVVASEYAEITGVFQSLLLWISLFGNVLTKEISRGSIVSILVVVDQPLRPLWEPNLFNSKL
jgi:hypothetical protein